MSVAKFGLSIKDFWSSSMAEFWAIFATMFPPEQRKIMFSEDEMAAFKIMEQKWQEKISVS